MLIIVLGLVYPCRDNEHSFQPCAPHDQFEYRILVNSVNQVSLMHSELNDTLHVGAVIVDQAESSCRVVGIEYIHPPPIRQACAGCMK